MLAIARLAPLLESQLPALMILPFAIDFNESKRYSFARETYFFYQPLGWLVIRLNVCLETVKAKVLERELNNRLKSEGHVARLGILFENTIT
jgi:hypothetical protein